MKPRFALAVLLALSALPAFSARAGVDPVVFEKEIGARIDRVSEFQAIRSIAEELGIRAWIFGGTASAFGHYVRWDLERAAGDPRYGPGRFDYHYSNIYRSSQDLDVVVDASEDQRELFEEQLQKRFPYLQGEKDKWEVRLLREKSGDKESLLGNRDFLDQHTDSNSTGMIEISRPRAEESVVRDLRRWDAPTSDFLEDLAKGTIHYYFSPTHETTSRALAGKNPEILSAIRYLTKIVQYDLQPAPQDLETVRSVVTRFEPGKIKDAYVRKWIEKNAAKLLQNATDVESAWNLIEEVGLRNKLISIKKGSNEERSLAWWLNKEPLRTFPLGQGPGPSGKIATSRGKGKTARELKITTLAHGTSDFAAFEALTLSPVGLPNFFVSRDGHTSETAAYGNGVYFRIGSEGAGQTDFTVRVTLHPDAVAGKDFLLVTDEFVVVVNRNAIRVIPESLSVDLTEWFRMLYKGNQFSDADQGIIQGIRSRVEKDAVHITETQDREISAVLSEASSNPKKHKIVFEEWSRLRLDLQNFKMEPLDEFRLMTEGIMDLSPSVKKVLMEIRGLSHAKRWPKFRNAVSLIKNKQDRALHYFGWLAAPTLSLGNSIEEMFDILFTVNGGESHMSSIFYEKWSERMDQLLTKELSPERIAQIRTYFRKHLPDRGKELHLILDSIRNSKLPGKVLQIDDWIDLAAKDRIYADEWTLPQLREILMRTDGTATQSARQRALEIARGVSRRNGGLFPPSFYAIWINLTITSAEAPDLVVGKGFTRKQIKPMFESEASSKVFAAAIERADGPTFNALMKEWVQFFETTHYCELLSELADPVIRRLIAEPAAAKGFPFDSVVKAMRTSRFESLSPFFRRWVEGAIESGKTELLVPLADSFYFDRIQQMEPEFEKLVTFILADPKKNTPLLAILLKRVTLKYNSGKSIQEQFKRIFRYVAAEKRTDLFAVMPKGWFELDAIQKDRDIAISLIDVFAEKRDWKGLEELVSSSQGLLSEEGFDRILRVSDENKIVSVFKKLVETLPRPTTKAKIPQIRRSLAKLAETADRHRWVGALNDLAGFNSVAFHPGDVPIGAVLDLLDLAFRHQDQDFLHSLIFWHFRGKNKALSQELGIAHRELIRRAILLRASKDKKEKAFAVFVLKEMDANLRGSFKSAELPADVKRDYKDYFAREDGKLLKRYAGLEEEVASTVKRHRKLATPRACPKLLEKP